MRGSLRQLLSTVDICIGAPVAIGGWAAGETVLTDFRSAAPAAAVTANEAHIQKILKIAFILFSCGSVMDAFANGCIADRADPALGADNATVDHDAGFARIGAVLRPARQA